MTACNRFVLSRGATSKILQSSESESRYVCTIKFYQVKNRKIFFESIEQKNIYRIYSSEHPGHSLNFGLSRDGTYSKKALSFEVGTHYINQQDIKILSTCLFNQTMRTVIITRIKCLMFKLVCKTPLFTNEKQHCKLN